MEELSQQSMLERPVPQSIIVPRGRSSWWGLDPSTRGASLAWVAPDGSRGVRTHLSGGEGLERLHSSFTVGRMVAIDVLGLGFAPGILVVEQPSGKVTNNALVMAVGAICAGVVSALAGQSTRLEMIVPSWWKARACGNGGIKKTYIPRGGGKAKPLPTEEYGVMKWARLNGYGGSSWDEADALAMAEAAHREWALVER